MSPSRKRPSKPLTPPSSPPSSQESSPQPELKAPPRPPNPPSEHLIKATTERAFSKTQVVDPQPAPSITKEPDKTQIKPESESSGAASTLVQSPNPETISIPRLHPIPPPSEPMQYRAIGLVRGCYTPGEEELSQGTFKSTADGFELPAILLGRVLSLVKNHLNLAQDYLWVVYPRVFTKPRSPQTLSFQILGVWDPALLNRIEEDSDTTSASSPQADSGHALEQELEDGYFSVRGEVIAFSEETQEVTVSIRQMPRKPNQEGKSFKLPLKGTLSGKVVGQFWDLEVHHQRGTLEIREGNRIGFVAPKKRSETSAPKGKAPYRKPGSGFEPPTPGHSTSSDKPAEPLARRDPPSKPVKKPRLSEEE